MRFRKWAAIVSSVLLCGGPWSWPAAFAQEDEGGFVDAISRWLGGDSEQIDYENATPSHVFRWVRDMSSEIAILRDEMGVSDYPPEAELHDDRIPVHSYVKSLEVLNKVIGIQNRFGVPPADRRETPLEEVTPGDVLANVVAITGELRKIKSQMVIEREIEPAALVGGKTPSMVYKALADASLMLDGLRGQPLMPSDIYENCQDVFDDMDLIAGKLRVPINITPPEVDGSKTYGDVAQQALRAVYKTISLQTRLGMSASAAPKLTMVRVSSSEVYDMTNILLAEMARIKLHQDIDVPRVRGEPVRVKTPADVFALLLLIIENLDALAAGV